MKEAFVYSKCRYRLPLVESNVLRYAVDKSANILLLPRKKYLSSIKESTSDRSETQNIATKLKSIHVDVPFANSEPLPQILGFLLVFLSQPPAQNVVKDIERV